MKALAAEMVRNFGKRLEPLGVSVKELTGDMQLTKAEIMKTQVRVDIKHLALLPQATLFGTGQCSGQSSKMSLSAVVV